MKKYLILLFLVCIYFSTFLISGCKEEKKDVIYIQNDFTYFESLSCENSYNLGDEIKISAGKFIQAYNQTENFDIWLYNDAGRKNSFDIVKHEDETYTFSLNTAGKLLTKNKTYQINSNIKMNTYSVNLYSDSTKSTLLDTYTANYADNFDKNNFNLSTIPSKEGYHHIIKTDYDYTSITSSYDAYVEYIINTYTVYFYEDEQFNRLITLVNGVEYNSEAIFSRQAPTQIGYAFVGWSQDIKNVKSNMQVYAIFEPLLRITLYDGDEVYSCYRIKKGEDLVLSSQPTKAGLEFDGLIGNTTNLQSDTNLTIKWKGKNLSLLYNLSDTESFEGLQTQVINTKDLLDAGDNGIEINTPIRENCFFYEWKNYGNKLTYNKIAQLYTLNNNLTQLTLNPVFKDNAYKYNEYGTYVDNKNKTWLTVNRFKQFKDDDVFEVPNKVWNGQEYLDVFSIQIENFHTLNAKTIKVDCHVVDFYFAYYSTKLEEIVIGEHVSNILNVVKCFNTQNTVDIVFVGNEPINFGTLCFKGLTYQIKVPNSSLENWRSYYPSAIGY